MAFLILLVHGTPNAAAVQTQLPGMPARMRLNATSMTSMTLDPGDGGAPINVVVSNGRVVFQKRTSDSVDFQRTWADYKVGFGDNDSFWLGNDNIHRLTAAYAAQDPAGTNNLRVELTDADDTMKYATYTDFSIEAESPNYYRSTFSGYVGDAGDGMAVHDGMMFSTPDADHDSYAIGSCASMYHGGWWYNKCHESNLNGLYVTPGPTALRAQTVCWIPWRGSYYSLQSTEMSIDFLPSWVASTPVSTPTPPTVSGTGDPHLQNLHGERFDLMRPGQFVLINIPRGKPVEDALLVVEADARRLGGQCADMYFEKVNITGAWADKVQPGGLRFDARDAFDERPQWAKFGPVGLKVARGRTDKGLVYYNIFAKHLLRAGFHVGGLLGEDDHSDADKPTDVCVQTLALTKGKATSHLASEAVAM